MRRMKAVTLMLVAAWAWGCGGGDGDGDGRPQAGSGGPSAGQGGGATFDAGSDPGRNDVVAGEICERVAVIQCAGERACCDAPGRTFEACQSSVQGACEDSLMLDTIGASPMVAFDPAKAKTAFGEFERRAAMCDPAVGAWAVSADGFSSTFTGTLGSGENCEPMGGLQAPIDKLLIALASCRIGDGLVCLPGDAGWMCAPRAAVGARCFNDFNCVDGSYCENPDGEFNGVCTAGKAMGSDCDGPIECESRICGDGKCAPDGDVQAAYCGA
jgi:hypothetical protein